MNEYVCWKHKGFDFFQFCVKQLRAVLNDYDTYLSPESRKRVLDVVVASRINSRELADG